jgi:spermidine synthase
VSPPKLVGILTCFFFSGAAGLIYQVAWAKALALIFGHTTYAVATVLAVFMAGLQRAVHISASGAGSMPDLSRYMHG